MKFNNYLLTLLLLALIPLRSYAQTPASDPQNTKNWKLLDEFSDDFNGTQIDDSKWYDYNPQWKGRKPGYFSRDNVNVQNGYLQLTAKYEDLAEMPDGYHTYTTAAVKSKGTVKYGYFEIRCQSMTSSASSAFWLYENTTDNWTEIDIFEIGGTAKNEENAINTNVHVFHTPTDDTHWQIHKKLTVPFKHHEEFHTYGLEWDEENIKWFVDGELYRSIPNTNWHFPLTINMDSETFPDWFGLPDPSDLPATYKIDYVRTWQVSDEEVTEPTVPEEKTSNVDISGELKKWHKVTFTFDGPELSETAATPNNPFKDYRADITFKSPSGKTYKVPGYFAADGNAAETSATSGNKWRAHFAPDEIGTWTYTASFVTGTNIATSTSAGTSASYFDGMQGSFKITASDKTGVDLRAKGRLEYVGEHYLKFAETGEYFLKGGPDAPENFLAYEDFDNTPNNGSRRKSWSPHAQDYKTGNPSWKSGKGTEIIGAINYLASKGLNVFSFLTMNINGDDQNVYPYVSNSDYQHFDVSKLDQWEIVFNYATTQGMYLHFKTQETENELLLDNGSLGVNRKLYYRELIARFGHHLALNWNLGEENNNQTDQQRKDMAQYFYDTDPYHHNVVIHTYPTEHDKIYTPLLGSNSKLTGASIQTSWEKVHSVTIDWLTKSANAGTKWVVANDEQNSADIGVPHDDYTGTPNLHNIRKKTLWGNLMAGGAGVEYYFGYQLPESDLNCQDFRSRDQSWTYVNYALDFFTENVPFWEMSQNDGLASNAWCMAKTGEVYVLYFENTSTTGTVNLSGISGTASLEWFNPRTGQFVGDKKYLTASSNTAVGTPPNNASEDWVALIKADGEVPVEVEPTITMTNPTNGLDFNIGSEINISINVEDVNTSEISKVEFYVNGSKIGEDATSPYSYLWTSNSTGSVSLQAKVTLNSGSVYSSESNNITISNPTSDACAADYVEKDGLVIIEAESQNSTGWSANNSIDGFTGNGYLVWSDVDYASAPSNDLINYKFEITEAGTYRVQLRNRIAEGNNSTESNDSWLRFPDATMIAKRNGELAYANGGFGVPDGATIVPGSTNGWFKIYVNELNTWSWQTTTWDNNSHNIFVEFSTPGIYNVQISGRSKGHAIDRIVLYQTSIAHETALSTDLTETLCEGEVVENQLPTVSITSPTNGSSYKEGDAVTFTADANDTDGTVAKVQFYNGNTLIGEDATEPFEIIWENVTAGNYTITATAFDNSDASSSSQTTITVLSNQLPTVAITSPETNDSFTVGNTITITADANDTDGNIEKVQFYNGNTLIGEDTTEPYEVEWNNSSAGSYTIIATAFDNDNTSASTKVSFTLIAEEEPTQEPIASEFLFSPIHDAYLEKGNRKNNKDLRIEYNRRDTYLQFNIEGIAEGASVEKATLNLKVGSDNGKGTLRIFKASHNDWTEFNLSNGNKPSKEAELDQLQGSYSNPNIYSFDVTDAISENGYVSFIVSMDAGGNDVSFMSKENSTAPELIISTLESPEIEEEVEEAKPVVSNFMLINATSDTDIKYLVDLDKIILSELASDKLNVRYDISDTNAKSVIFFMNGSFVRTENVAPYVVYGDKDGDYFDWTPTAGTYTLTAKVYSELRGGGNLLKEEIVTFEVINTLSESFAITYPSDGSEVETNKEVTITANVPSQANGRVKDVTVSFYVNGNKIGEATQYPYQINWSTFTKGRYTITASMENNNQLEIAPEVNISAIKLTNILPEIDWLNSMDKIYEYTKNVTLETSVTDKDGKVEKVEFYNGEELLAEVTKVPYSFKWVAPDPGIYEITAKAFDDDGDVSISEGLSFTVLLPNGDMPVVASGDKDGNPFEEIVEEEEAISFDVAFGPNPVTSFLKIKPEYNLEGNLSITAFSIDGRKINLISETIYQPDTIIELGLHHLKNGLYIIEVSLDDQKKTFKIIKE